MPETQTLSGRDSGKNPGKSLLICQIVCRALNFPELSLPALRFPALFFLQADRKRLRDSLLPGRK